MDNHTNSAHEETREWVYEDGNEAIETVISMLSPAAAAETTRFMVDTSVCGLTIQTDPRQGAMACSSLLGFSSAPRKRSLSCKKNLKKLSGHPTDVDVCSLSSARRPCEAIPTPRQREHCGNTTSSF